MTAFMFWGTLALATVLAIIAAFAILRYGRQGFGAVATVILVAGLGWVALERLDRQGRAEQRRAIEARLNALSAQALLPNSNLACLDAAGGDVIHEACERALFSGPEQIAAALNYVGARLDALREFAALPEHDGAADGGAYDSLRTPIVRSLEADRFGLVAQVLMARDDCKPSSCYAFDFLPRRDQIVANMNEGAYQARVTRFAATWNGGQPSAPVLAVQPAPQPSPSGTPANIDFPTAASIPAVSIMSNEPGRPGQNGVAATPKTEARSEPPPEVRAESKPEPRSEPRAEPKSEPRQQAAQPPQPPRRPAQKAQARPATPAPAPAAPAPAAADPFPQPVGAAPQTTGAQPQ